MTHLNDAIPRPNGHTHEKPKPLLGAEAKRRMPGHGDGLSPGAEHQIPVAVELLDNFDPLIAFLSRPAQGTVAHKSSECFSTRSAILARVGTAEEVLLMATRLCSVVGNKSVDARVSF